jgi:hypothetical protein
VAASTTEGGTAPVQGRLWSARARDWAEVQEATTVLPLFEAIADSLGVGAGTRVLDVGCGAGRFLRLAADRGADVAGLDPTAALVAIARERLPGGPSRGRDGAAAVERRQLRHRLGHQRLPVRGPARRGRRRSGPRRPARRPGRGRHLGPPEDCEAAAYLGALGMLLPPPPPGAPGPFALSQPGALASLARAPPGSSPRRKPVSRRSGSTRTRRRCCAGCSPPAPQLAPSRRPAKPACAMPSWRRSLPTAHQAVPTGCTTPSATPSRRTGEAAAIAWADRAGRGTIGA